jgi:multicomponent Na+:H+ antiporter subunit F
MFTAATIAVLVTLALAVARALAGPTVFDRLLAANSVGTAAILLLLLLGFLTDRPEFTDIAMTYVILNLIGMIAVIRFFTLLPEDGSAPSRGQPP